MASRVRKMCRRCGRSLTDSFKDDPVVMVMRCGYCTGTNGIAIAHVPGNCWYVNLVGPCSVAPKGHDVTGGVEIALPSFFTQEQVIEWVRLNRGVGQGELLVKLLDYEDEPA